MANEKAKNNLESYIFETKDWLELNEVVAVSIEEQREEIRVAFREVSDWFEEEGYYSAETAVNPLPPSLPPHLFPISLSLSYIIMLNRLLVEQYK